MKESARAERRILITLSVMLIGVFLLSIHMYDRIEEGTDSGVLAVFAENAREFVYGNEAVAAFLGIEEESPEKTAEETTHSADDAAMEYIQRYNLAYADID